MKSSFLRVIFLYGAILNLFLCISRTESLIRRRPIPVAQIFQICKQLCPGCDNDSLQFLFRHNIVRAMRMEPPLVWDRRLQQYAQWWANQRRSDCALQHSLTNGQFNYGENIYMGYGAEFTPADAVLAWAGEKKFYNYRSNSCDDGQMCGHYTQIVWKTTRRVGCARVVCNSGAIFMTCNYDPPGNYIGQRPY